jgi:hypothetical protein
MWHRQPASRDRRREAVAYYIYARIEVCRRAKEVAAEIVVGELAACESDGRRPGRSEFAPVS